ncbi:MAG TPA: LPS assembly lipoprotein LptE [Burkholderiales bacterium]|nr:LPS assembly lipoprotein LptE [Burkholderiales bacterium]
MRAAALLAALLLAACGFQLRGSVDLPFDTLYMPNATSGIALDLKRQIQSGSATRVVDDPNGAQARLQFTEETRTKEILSLTTAGRVREYRLRYRVSFRVEDAKGGTFVPPNTVALQRDLTYDDSVALAKEGEEELLFRDMQNDMVQQILRRLVTARAPSAN